MWSTMQPILTSLSGLILLVGIAWGISSNRRLFPWRIVLVGIALQFGLAAATILTVPGRRFELILVEGVLTSDGADGVSVSGARSARG